LTGHAPTAPPRWLSTPAVTLHVVMAAFWIGSLWPLLVTLRTLPTVEAAAVVRRFSALAVGGVALLVAAGAVLSLLQIGRPAAVLETAYGRVWLAKMAMVSALLVLAAVNFRILTPTLDHGGADAAARLRRSILAELVLVAGILLATAGFTLTPPPRALALQPTPEHGEHEHGEHEHGQGEEAPAGYAVSATVGGRTALIEVDPARTGRNTVTVHLTGPDGAPLTPLEAGLEMALPDAGIEPVARRLTAVGLGAFTLADADLPLPGRWGLRLAVLVGDFEKTVFRAEIPIAPGR
jgi:copper transport protein